MLNSCRVSNHGLSVFDHTAVLMGSRRVDVHPPGGKTVTRASFSAQGLTSMVVPWQPTRGSRKSIVRLVSFGFLLLVLARSMILPRRRSEWPRGAQALLSKATLLIVILISKHGNKRLYLAFACPFPQLGRESQFVYCVACARKII